MKIGGIISKGENNLGGAVFPGDCDKPLVSVVIPTHNRAKQLTGSIQSVLNQTWENTEVIVVDDGSTDNTKAVIASFDDKRLKYIQLDKNRGACYARNRGIELAAGDYIAFNDSDDIWRSAKIETQLKSVWEHKADISVCRFARHRLQNKATDVCPDIDPGLIDYQTILSQTLFSTPTILAPKRILEQFKFNNQLGRLQDFDWLIRAAEKHRVVMNDEVLVDSFIQDDSITNSGPESLLDACLAIRNSNIRICREYPILDTFLLEAIVFFKCIVGDDARREVKELYTLSPSPKNAFKVVTTRLGLLPLLYRLREHRKRSSSVTTVYKI